VKQPAWRPTYAAGVLTSTARQGLHFGQDGSAMSRPVPFEFTDAEDVRSARVVRLLA
jgi:hypothetical protein